jgi:hypothetical protein
MSKPDIEYIPRGAPDRRSANDHLGALVLLALLGAATWVLFKAGDWVVGLI